MHVTTIVIVLKQPKNMVETKNNYKFKLNQSIFSLNVRKDGYVYVNFIAASVNCSVNL